MDTTYPNVNTLWAAVLADELARCGLRDCVISPGSRSTPLVLAIAAHGDIRDHSVLDERAAGFLALGLARATRRPVALVCTSGTAAANYLPAVCEADLARVPLLVLTADRPAHLRDAGAPQTMDQARLFGTHVRWSHEVAQPEADEQKLRALRSLACHAMAAAAGEAGPVHLNLPFRKPLEPVPAATPASQVPEDFPRASELGVPGREDGGPYTRIAGPWNRSLDERADCLADLILRHPRALLAAGPDSAGRAARAAVARFASASGMPVLAEAASQLRFDPARPARVLGSGDLLLRTGTGRALADRATLVIRTGSWATNQPMQRFLSAPRPAQVQLTPALQRVDPEFTATHCIVAPAPELLDAVADRLLARAAPCVDAAWAEELCAAAEQADRQCAALLDADAGLWEAQVARALVAAMPSESALFVSSSMPVRDVESFATRAASDIDAFFNRGVNGIDGILASGAGTALGRTGSTVVLTGDVAFLHDIDGLLAAARAGARMTIVAVNNDGGELFGMLPVAEFEPAYTRHFLTPHGATFEGAAALAGCPHRRVERLEDLAPALRDAIADGALSIVEVRTEARTSRERRRALYARVDAAVAPRASTEAGAAADNAAAAADASAGPRAVFPLPLRRLARGDASAAPLLLLHGFTRSGAMWRGFVRGLPPRQPALAVDMMGHGMAPAPDERRHPEAWTLAYQTRRVVELLTAHARRPAHLVGYSMGGRVAMLAALEHPELVASLTLVSTSPGIADAGARAERRAADLEIAGGCERGLHAFIEQWMAGPLFAAQRERGPRFLQEARDDRLGGSGRGFASSLRGMGQGAIEDLWSRLPAIARPVLLVAGERDHAYLDIMRRMAPLLASARLEIVPGAGHDVPSEQPELLRELLFAYLQEHASE